MKIINQQTNRSLLFRDLGIDTNQELVVFMPATCKAFKSEGFRALTRLSISLNRSTIVATLNTISSDLLKEGEISLSKKAIQKLKVKDNDLLRVSHAETLNSISFKSHEYRLKLIVTDIDVHTKISMHWTIYLSKLEHIM